MCRRGGFTLLELIIVIAISFMLLGVGAIRISHASILMAASERVARRLVADLRFAQSQAITDARNHYLLFTSNGTKFVQYAIFRADPSGDVQILPYAVFRADPSGDVQILPTRTLPDEVALTGNSSRAEFTPGGDALAAYSFTITSPGRSYSVSVVMATGAVVLQEN